MDDIHAPTVPSGPVSQPVSNGVGGKKTLQELIAHKENLEAELSALGSVLDSHGVNMNTTLTTFDGYPRADIDVAQIRTTRARIIRLKNDHKALMKELEEAVHAQFAASKGATGGGSVPGTQHAATSTASSADNASTPATSSSASNGVPFAKVNSVVANSPAEVAGLKVGDEVTTFGYVNWTNHERLSKVAQVVQQNEDRPILVKVLRSLQTIELILVPRKDWGGRDYLTRLPSGDCDSLKSYEKNDLHDDYAYLNNEAFIRDNETDPIMIAAHSAAKTSDGAWATFRSHMDHVDRLSQSTTPVLQHLQSSESESRPLLMIDDLPSSIETLGSSKSGCSMQKCFGDH